MQHQTFIFFGRSGSGKGTQAELLRKYLEERGGRVVYIETGERFRSFMQGETHTAALTRQIIGSGALMPVFMPIWLWTNELVAQYTGYEHLVLDGLCRRVEEAPVLDSALKFYGIQNPHIVYINVSNAWATQRMQGRGRTDDTEHYIASRLAWFDRDVLPVLDYFRAKPEYQFHEINGEQSIEAVFQDIQTALQLAS